MGPREQDEKQAGGEVQEVNESCFCLTSEATVRIWAFTPSGNHGGF